MTKNSRFLQNLASRVAAGASVRSAAAEVGCSERTGYAIAATDEFRDLVSRARSEAIQQAVGILAANATAASNALVRLLQSDDQRVVLASASKLLDRIGPLQELTELRERIELLEKQQPLRVAR